MPAGQNPTLLAEYIKWPSRHFLSLTRRTDVHVALQITAMHDPSLRGEKPALETKKNQAAVKGQRITAWGLVMRVRVGFSGKAQERRVGRLRKHCRTRKPRGPGADSRSPWRPARLTGLPWAPGLGGHAPVLSGSGQRCQCTAWGFSGYRKKLAFTEMGSRWRL